MTSIQNGALYILSRQPDAFTETVLQQERLREGTVDVVLIEKAIGQSPVHATRVFRLSDSASNASNCQNQTFDRTISYQELVSMMFRYDRVIVL
jgi:hypothetical protein